MRLSLCEGRHNISGVEGYIYPRYVKDPTDLVGLASTAHEALKDCTELDLFVTGLSVALTTVIRYCADHGITLTLYHYDKLTGEYYRQPMAKPKPE
jgi:hypothetical protein